MRAFFVLMLVANLLLIGWFMFGQEEQEQVAQPPRPVSGSLTLLSEAAPDLPGERAADDEQASPPEPREQPPPAAPAEPACYLSQAFVEQRDARQLRAAAGDPAEVQESPESELVGHWVYLPPADDVAAAREIVEQLREAGIEDVQIVGEAAYSNAISLGVFSSAGRARARQQAMQDSGFAAELGERYRSVTRYRVLLRDWDADRLPGEGQWETIDCQAVSD